MGVITTSALQIEEIFFKVSSFLLKKKKKDEKDTLCSSRYIEHRIQAKSTTSYNYWLLVTTVFITVRLNYGLKFSEEINNTILLLI